MLPQQLPKNSYELCACSLIQVVSEDAYIDINVTVWKWGMLIVLQMTNQYNSYADLCIE